MKLEIQKKYNELKINGSTISSENLNKYISSENPQWKSAIYDFLQQWWDENPFIKIKTSGSTGKPKTIAIEKEKMVASAIMTGTYFSFKENQNALLCLPAEYIAGRMMMIRSMVWKLNLISVEPLVNPLEELKKVAIDFAAMIPLQVFNCINSNPEKLSLIKKTIIGGGEISNENHSSLQSFETEFYATYGMTETITHVAIKKLNGKDRSDYFKCLPGIEISIDERDCLVINAPSLSEKEIVTNDIVKIMERTSFQWLGRWDNVINTGGKKFHPEQMEKKTESIIKERHFFTSLPDTVLGSKIVLIIEGEKREYEYLLSQLEAALTKHGLPKTVFFTNEFEETSTGKINRAATLQKALASR